MSEAWRSFSTDDKQRMLQRLQVRAVTHGSDTVDSPLALGRMVFGPAWQDARHLYLLNEKLMAVERGEIDRLMVFMPPRHSKSENCSHFFPAWFLGRNPDKSVIVAGYSSTFAEEWGRKARNTLVEFNELFGGVEIDQDSKAVARWKIAGRRGGMVSTGIGGALTGRGADLFCIDDPLKDQEQAFSAVYRKRCYEWYQSVALTRLSPEGRVVLVCTRWHDEDLAGLLLKNMKEDPEADQWEIINFPAIAEEHDILGRSPGEALWPERYPLEKLNRIRANMPNDYWWHALYQQTPPTELGRVIDTDLLRGWMAQGNHYRLYDALTGGSMLEAVESPSCQRIITVDCAGTSEDVVKEARGRAPSYSVVMTIDVHNGRFIIRDIDRGRWAFPELLQHVTTAYRIHQPSWMGVEDEKTGRALIQVLMPQGFNVRALSPEGKDKLTRASEFLNRLKQGQIYVNKEAPWKRDLVSEMALWTGHPDETSDQIDCLAYACREWQRGAPNVVRIESGMISADIGGGTVFGGW